MTGTPDRTTASRIMRLRISDLSSGQTKVALALPLNLLAVAQRVGAQLLPSASSAEAILAQAQQGSVTPLAWIDKERNERLELTVQ